MSGFASSVECWGDTEMSSRGQQMDIFSTCRALAVLASGLLIGTFVPPAFAAESPGTSIDQSSYVTIGGIEQWINIKGQVHNNPRLLVLHGGPGGTQVPPVHKSQT